MNTLKPLGYDPNKKNKSSNTLLILVVFLFLLVGIGFGAFYFRDQLFSQSTTKKYQKAKETTENAPDFSKWQYYQDPDSIYAIRIPPEWSIDQKRNKDNEFMGEVTFMPSEKGKLYGSIKKIHIISAETNDRNIDYPRTQREFDKWFKAENNYKTDNLIKVDTDMIQKNKAVIFLDSDRAPNNGYYLNAWTIVNGINYYISVEGDKKIDIDDIYAFKYLLKTMTFK